MNNQNGNRLKPSISLKIRVIMLVIAAVIVTGFVSTWQAISALRENTIEGVQREVSDMLSVANMFIDDAQLAESILQGEETPYISELQKELYNFKSNTALVYLYTLVDRGSQVSTIFDAANEYGSPDYLEYGYMEDKGYYEGIDETFSKGTVLLSDVYDYEDPNTGEVQKIISEYRPVFDDKGNVIAVFGGDMDVTEAFNEFDIFTKKLITMIVVLSVVFIIVAFVSGLIMFAPLDKLIACIKLIADGDFTKEYKYYRNNEIGHINIAVEQMSIGLKEMIEGVKSDSGDVGGISTELREKMDDIDTNIKEMNMAMESVAKSASEQIEDFKQGMNDIDALKDEISRSLDSFTEVNRCMEVAKTSEQEGIIVVDRLSAQTKESEKAITRIAEDIRKTVKRIEKIGAAGEKILNISSMTDLLSLNATIEASKAGEFGKGFMVVAEEIKKLSEQSDIAANEISDIIKDLTANESDMFEAVKELEEVSEKQVESVNETEAQFSQISDAIQETMVTFAELNKITKQMNKSKDHINRIFNEFFESAETNAAATEEMSGSMQEQTAIIGRVAEMAEHLSEMARTMENKLRRFTT